MQTSEQDPSLVWHYELHNLNILLFGYHRHSLPSLTEQWHWRFPLLCLYSTLCFANVWHPEGRRVARGATPGTSEGIFLVVSQHCKWLVRGDTWKRAKHCQLPGMPLYLITFPSKVFPETTTDTKRLALWKSASGVEIVKGHCLICNLKPWQICIAGTGSAFLATASLFEPTFSQRQSFHVLKFSWKNLDFFVCCTLLFFPCCSSFPSGLYYYYFKPLLVLLLQ